MMTKIDIISGFLGAGKTTLIKKLLTEALKGEQVVLIENEFGEIGIDGGFLKEAGIVINEMNSGCICCSLVGDFGEALREVIETYHPDRILIEPSGVGKLSDVIHAVEGVAKDMPVELDSFVTVADVAKCKMYIKNFGEFFLNQIEHAGAIILSRTQNVTAEKLEAAVALLREHNEKARILTTPWDELTGAQMLAAMEEGHSLSQEMMQEIEEAHHHHEHHHHEHDEDCDCGCHDHEHHEHHHHEHDEHCDCHGHDHDHEHHDHEHHHHEHDEHCDCHDHEHHHEHEHEHHHHDHDEHCDCGCHDHEHHHEHEHHHHEHDEHCTCGCHDHHHHHADEVFTSWGRETVRKYTREEIEAALNGLQDEKIGTVLRAKGIVACADGGWLHFDYTPGEPEVRMGAADYTGRLCVIGAELDEAAIAKLFGVA